MYNNNYYSQTQRPYYNNYGGTSIQPQMIQSQIMLKGRPVASFEEAKAQTVDFDGSVFFFPDLANNRIYTKQINLDGTMSLRVYELQDFAVNTSNEFSSYVTREEFESTISKIHEKLSAETQPKGSPNPAPAEFLF